MLSRRWLVLINLFLTEGELPRSALEFAASRLSMMRIMARRTKAATVTA